MTVWKKKLQMPNNKKYLSMLGMARRAGKLAMGHDMALGSIKSKKATLLLLAKDMSPRIEKEFKKHIDNYNCDIPIIRIDESINDIHMALGYKAGVITVDDNNFSRRIIELINLNQEENEYDNKG